MLEKVNFSCIAQPDETDTFWFIDVDKCEHT